jgi:hypothetical protein
LRPLKNGPVQHKVEATKKNKTTSYVPYGMALTLIFKHCKVPMKKVKYYRRIIKSLIPIRIFEPLELNEACKVSKGKQEKKK